jgi:hypothetical protein
MLWRILAVAGLIGLIAAIVLMTCQQKQAACQAQAKSPDDGNETPLVINPAIEENLTAKNAASSSDCAPCWHVLLTWPEGITAWAVIFTLFAIAWQSAETARAAKAAQMAIEHSIASERAWILPEMVWIGSGAKDAPEGSDQVFVLCSITNHGNTPARVFGMNAVWGIGPIAEPAKTWSDSLYSFNKKAKPKWVVLPDKHTALSVPIPGFTATAKSKIPIATKAGETMFIHGVIRYWDMFCKVDRLTRFCYRWESAEENPAMPEGYHQAGGGNFNQQT